MERVTRHIPRRQIEQVETGECPDRSEAIRSAVRTMVGDEQGSRPDRDVAQV